MAEGLRDVELRSSPRVGDLQKWDALKFLSLNNQGYLTHQAPKLLLKLSTKTLVDNGRRPG
ncbi:MAG: hypothetical protein AAGH78_16480, partial [Cyanobacteria bacterium P01_H01_bin.58]